MSNIKEQIIFEDNHLIVVNKLPKQLVQRDKTQDPSLLEHIKSYLKHTNNKPGNVFLGLTHRLDRPCSGIVIYAKTSKALERVNMIFRDKKIKKTYLAITENQPNKNDDKLTNWLVKNEKLNKSFICEPNTPESKLAELNYSLLANSDRYSLIKVDLITGRHHQIRVQLAAIGCPIKGDLKYGAKRSNKDASISLHAYKVEFIHPVSQKLMRFYASTRNENLWNYFQISCEITDKSFIIQQNIAGITQVIDIN